MPILSPLETSMPSSRRFRIATHQSELGEQVVTFGPCRKRTGTSTWRYGRWIGNSHPSIRGPISIISTRGDGYLPPASHRSAICSSLSESGRGQSQGLLRWLMKLQLSIGRPKGAGGRSARRPHAITARSAPMLFTIRTVRRTPPLGHDDHVRPTPRFCAGPA
jgi:hypothetical protein